MEDSKPEVDQERIQEERHNRELVERQLDGWKTQWSHTPGHSTWGDGAYFPWRTSPIPLTGRRSIRLLFLLVSLMVIAFVIIFIVGYTLL